MIVYHTLSTAHRRLGVINFPRWDDGYTTRKEFKQQAQEKFTHSETLRNITLTLQVSYTKYDPAEFNNASEFLGDGINSLQYDV